MTYFEFPDAVRVPCEQYLLYFAQFLRDLGVEASSELRHEVGMVLFSVTPTDLRTNQGHTQTSAGRKDRTSAMNKQIGRMGVTLYTEETRANIASPILSRSAYIVRRLPFRQPVIDLLFDLL